MGSVSLPLWLFCGLVIGGTLPGMVGAPLWATLVGMVVGAAVLYGVDRHLRRANESRTPDSAPGAPTVSRDIKLGDDVKARYPEQWQQDAILNSWRTGRPTVGRAPVDEP